MAATPYLAPSDAIVHRLLWAQARLAGLAETARRQGWLHGAPPQAWVEPDVAAALIEGSSALTAPALMPLEAMAAALGLTEVELDALWLLVCVETEPVIARLLGSLGESSMSVLMLQRLVTPSGRLAGDGLTVTAIERLARLGLVEVGDPSLSLDRRSIRATDAVQDRARGSVALDGSLRGVVERVVANPASGAGGASGASHHRERFGGAAATGARVLLVAVGADGSGRGALLERTVPAGRGILRVRCRELADHPPRFIAQLRAIAREALVSGAVPLLADVDELGERVALLDRELLAQLDGPVLATARDLAAVAVTRPILTERVGLPTEEARRRLWLEVLPGDSAQQASLLAGRFPVSTAAIRRAGAAVAAAGGGEASLDTVRRSLRDDAERRLAGLAHRVTVRQGERDLVLPDETRGQLDELLARVRCRRQVLDHWGFADKVGRGLGVVALFSGPPGTGKTMAAGIVAESLGLDLYQVDLAQLVSKYIGETEKQLARVFDAVETSGSALLLDEADALLARRTAVDSATDRYANLESNFLLQRLESFTGVCILTSNHEAAIDDAFRRRLSLHARFALPDADERAGLWRAMLPQAANVAADLDASALGEAFAMAGGHIRNAVVRAAYLAADQGAAITMRHLWGAAGVEYMALGRLPPAGDF